MAARSKGWTRFGYLAAVVPVVVAGVGTLSDALTVAWLGSLIILVVTGFPRLVCLNLGYWGKVSCVFLVPLLGVALAATTGKPLAASTYEKALTIYESGSQGSVRLALWTHGLEAAMRSPWVGLGPGTHSGITAPDQGSEAHNSLVDWGASAGLLGLSAYALIIFHVMNRARKAKSPFLIAATAALFLFSLFHYTFRQPVFWFYMILILALSSKAPLVSTGCRRAL